MQIHLRTALVSQPISSLGMSVARLPLRTQSTNDRLSQDQLHLHSVRGLIPTEIGLFSSPAPQLNQALHTLHSHASEANFRAAQAQYRVSLRTLSVRELESLVQQLETEMKRHLDYRIQVFLDQALVDTRMEIFYKGGQANFPQPVMPPALGQDPHHIVNKTLQLLHSNPTEANYRTAQAAFRVAIRTLSLQELETTAKFLQQSMNQLSDYRSQKLLDSLELDLKLEIARKGGQPVLETPSQPPLPGQDPHSIVENTLKLLHSSPTEATFKTSEAGFRVALRRLTLAQLQQTEQLILAAIETETDYRTQKLLDALLTDLKLEVLQRPKA